jgi:hypothetical protein
MPSETKEATMVSTRTLARLASLSLLLSFIDCRAVTGIFKAGILAGVIVVLFVCALIFGAVRLFYGSHRGHGGRL